MKTNNSPATTFVDFGEVKAAVNIRQALDRYHLMDTLSQSGDPLSGSCPIHHGKNPTSFRLSLSKNCFNCFGSCRRGGNVIYFVALMEGIPFRDAALLLQDWFMGDRSFSPPSNSQSASRLREERTACLLDFTLVRSIKLPDGVKQPDHLSADDLAQLFE